MSSAGAAPLVASVLMVVLAVAVGLLQSRGGDGWCASCHRPIVRGRCSCPRSHGLRRFRHRGS